MCPQRVPVHLQGEVAVHLQDMERNNIISRFAELACPAHKLTEKGVPFKWTQECQTTFQTLKNKLVNAPILTFPDPGQTFILDTDASDVAIGAILSQKVDGFEKVVAYASRALSRQEKIYAMTNKELLAVVHFTSYFRHYLLGRRFLLWTDHSSLRWLHHFSEPEGQLARWLEQLAQFNYEIEHHPGKKHANADLLSRRPVRPAPLSCSEVISPTVEHEQGDLPVQRSVNMSRSGCSVVSAEASPRIMVQPNRPSIEAALGQNGILTCEPVNQLTLNVVCHVQEEQVSSLEDWDLVKAQKDDVDIQKLKPMKVNGQKGECDGSGTPTLRRLLELWDQLEVEQGLFVLSGGGPSHITGKQVVLPKSWVPKVLHNRHNTLTGGHLGVAKLGDKVQR
ncbi:hypothetical protein SRHO_G00158900 [Serrasalmus rhombeus]